MTITQVSGSTACVDPQRYLLGGYSAALRDGGPRLLARRTEGAEPGVSSCLDAATIERLASRSTSAREWLAGDSPLSAQVYKQLSAEGGPLNVLRSGLLDVRLAGSENAFGASKLLEQKNQGQTANMWAMGSPVPGSGRCEKETLGDLGKALKQWMKTADKLVSDTALPVSESTKHLPWLGSGTAAQRFCTLLAGLQDVKANACEVTKNYADSTLLVTLQGIEVADWATEQGVAKMWFAYASDAEKASIALALGQWMDSALWIMDRAREEGGTAVIRPTLK